MTYRTQALHTAAVATGNGNAMILSGFQAFSIQYLATGTPSAVLTFEGSVDNTNWAAISLLNASGAYVGTLAAPDIVHSPAYFALPYVRATMVYTSGSVTVVGTCRR